MSHHNTGRTLAKALAAAAATYQARSVIPHCAVCSRPCCHLDPLVLELEWKQIKSFWRIEESRPAFDKRLSTGAGPQEIRAGNGLYYVHGKPCPAYDANRPGCTVYDQPLKPGGCSDFPVYEDADALIADLRCEAVSLEDLVTTLADTLGPSYRIVSKADAEFPFLVTLAAKRAGGRRR